MLKVSENEIRQACALPEDNLPFSNRNGNQGAQPDMPLEEILGEIGRLADLPFEDSTTLPAQAYTSQEMFDWEVENIFRKEWYCLAHVSQIPEIGDFVNVDLLGEPLLVVRDKSEKIHVHSRVCPHRGMDIMPPGFGHDGHNPAEARNGESDCGHTRIFMCPYHSWTFELDGNLKACAEMQEARGFNRDEWSLRTYRSEVWNGFIFVNLDGDAPRSVAEQYAGLGDHLEKWNLADMELVFAREWDCPFNWKVLAENFMESYHHAGAHSKTLNPMMPARDTWTEEEKAHYIRCHLPFKPRLREKIANMESNGEQWDVFPPVPGVTGEDRNEWGLFLGFPTFKFVVTADSAIWYRTQPLGPDRMRLMTTMLVPKSTVSHPNFSEMLKEGIDLSVSFHLEDMEVCMAVQRGYYSSGYQRGRLSHLEKPIWFIHRYLAARARGTWPTMDRAASESQRPDLEFAEA
ncbi:MAG: aromatic ring-hydroxylating dioxygenase subunit alpha [Verrucomicrobiota bacterium]